MIVKIDNNDVVKHIRSIKRNDKQKCLSVKRNTKEEYIERLREAFSKNRVNVMSEKDYNVYRKGNRKYPESRTYRKVFGSWNEACRMCYGVTNKSFPERIESNVKSLGSGFKDSDLIRFVLEYKVKSRANYQKIRNGHPDFIPPVVDIISKYGSWGNFVEVVSKFSFDYELGRLVELHIKYGRNPTKKEIRDNGINLKLLLSKFFTVRKLLSIVKEMAVAIEIKEGNQRKDITIDGKVFEREKKKVFEQSYK